MPRRPAFVLAFVSLLLAAPATDAQVVDSLRGAWVLERVEDRRRGEVDRDPGHALLLFTESHVSVAMVVGDSLPRFADPSSPTEEEKAEAYDRLYTSAGPYRVKGDTLVVRPFVDESPRAMDRWPDHTERLRFRLDGDRLQLYNRSATQTFRRVDGRLGRGSGGRGVPAPGALPGADREGEDARRGYVAWDEVSFRYRRPAGWAAADLSELTRGTLDALVLMRNRRVAEERFGSGFRASTEDPLSLGSADNAVLSLARVPMDLSETDPAAFLREVVASGVDQILPGGEVTGEVRTVAVQGDSVPTLPVRGRDREGRQVRGWIAALPVGDVLLQCQLFAGPDVPAAALDSAVDVLGSVRPERRE